MPDHSSRYAIQLTCVPVNVNVARDPAVIDSLALLPLLNLPLFTLHDPLQVTAGLDCSTRYCEVPGVGVVEPPVAVDVEPVEVEPVEVEPVEVEPVEVEPVEVEPVEVEPPDVEEVEPPDDVDVELVPPTTSKASIQIHEPPEEAFFWPRTLIVKV
jgi:hypothetical protein